MLSASDETKNSDIKLDSNPGIAGGQGNNSWGGLNLSKFGDKRSWGSTGRIRNMKSKWTGIYTNATKNGSERIEEIYGDIYFNPKDTADGIGYNPAHALESFWVDIYSYDYGLNKYYEVISVPYQRGNITWVKFQVSFDANDPIGAYVNGVYTEFYVTNDPLDAECYGYRMENNLYKYGLIQ